MYKEDPGCRIMLLMYGVRPTVRIIGTSFGNLHPSQVSKIDNDTNRNRETSKFQTYIDEVKRDSSTILLDHMREDTEMSAVTAQHGLYDVGVATIKWCQVILGDTGFTVVDYLPGDPVP